MLTPPPTSLSVVSTTFTEKSNYGLPLVSVTTPKKQHDPESDQVNLVPPSFSGVPRPSFSLSQECSFVFKFGTSNFSKLFGQD